MTTIQSRGRVYTLLAIGTVLASDFATKLVFHSLGTLRWSQLVGTMIGAVLCWSLW